MDDLLYQLGNTLFQEYQWNQTNNFSLNNRHSQLSISKLAIRNCVQKTTRKQDCPLIEKQADTLLHNPFQEASLLNPSLKTIQRKTKNEDFTCFLDKPIAVGIEIFQMILDWMGIPCFENAESNHIKWSTWLENILEETYEAYQLLVQHFYITWKLQYRHQYGLDLIKSHPFELEEISSKLYGKEKMISLQTFSKWKNDNKQSTDSVSHKNFVHFYNIEYTDPLDDFLDIAGNETQDRIRQKYHPEEEETEKTVNNFIQQKTDPIFRLNIPKNISISAAFMSLIQQLMGCKSFVLLPPPLEILFMGVVMVYHYLTLATYKGQKCLWIAQDEYPFVAALLEDCIGPQLVFDLSSDKSCCYLCHVHHLSEIPRDEEFSFVVYTVQSFTFETESLNEKMYWEFCSPFIETCDACLIDPLSTNIGTVDIDSVVSMLNHSSSNMRIVDVQDTQLDNLLNHLRQTWIAFQPSGYQIEGLKMIEEHAYTYIQQLQDSCNLSIPCNVSLVDLSATSIENTLYKARHHVQGHFQTLQAHKPQKSYHHDSHLSYQTTSNDTFLSDIQCLIALHTLRTAYDYAQHDGLFGASKYLETAKNRYGSMLPCMRALQDILEDLGQVDKLLHPKTDLIIQISKQLKQTYEQHRKCLPNFRNIPFRILIITQTRYTTCILKRDLYNRGLKNSKSGIDIMERSSLLRQQDIRRYYAILDISILEWKPINSICFHEALSHWPICIAKQLYEWIMSQVVQYRCIVLDRFNCIQDSHLKWRTYDHLYQTILSRLTCKKTFNPIPNEDCQYGIYGITLGTVELNQGLNVLLSHCMEMYPHLNTIFLCCLATQPQNDRKHMIHLSTRIQMNPHFRRTFSVKFFFHNKDYERWLKSLTARNKKYKILRDW
ncbi:uncharacterized protein Gasu_40890 [Galdieria sulphuraria]|uniref:Uncharacterized protein n=1 Tax=Galdieria sulphuraria TaxID=130081 RepID=M2XXQ6_GALSU|nr:uncharacterized protein Gasu_40890 [Galdieria sulphuraria]EME28393.1 hypothetical protein Gasu_40890 [Galdieria sulphuraria]|eukprot:XP_005704913.1 hypothetical protein Gasu_40890 [Galdieria sulphuraria]